MAEDSFDPVLVPLSRTPQGRSRPKVSVLTLDADSLLPRLSRPITRNRSEVARAKLTFQRPYKPRDDLEGHMEALSIQASQPALVLTAQVFSVRDKAYRSADKGILPGRGKQKTAGIARTAVSFPTISSPDSEDSNELSIDLAKFLPSPHKRSINLREITVEEVFARRLRAQISPLTHLRYLKHRERVSFSPATVARTNVSRSLLQTFHRTRAGLAVVGEKGLELRGLRAYRVVEDPKVHRKVKMRREVKGKLKEIEDWRGLEA